jgi:hypothetical protein
MMIEETLKHTLETLDNIFGCLKLLVVKTQNVKTSKQNGQKKRAERALKVQQR